MYYIIYIIEYVLYTIYYILYIIYYITRGKSAPSIRQRKFRRLVRNGPRKKT